MTQAKIVTSNESNYHVLQQIDSRSFEDIRHYRLYQLALLESLGEDTLYRDIDFILKEDCEYEFSDDLQFVEDEKWKKDQLFRTSRRIVEELETYNALLRLMEPEEQKDDTLDESGETSIESLYQTLKRNLKILNQGFSKLPEQTDLDYTEPFQRIDDYGLF